MKKSVSLSIKTFALLSVLFLCVAGTVAFADDKPKELLLGGITALSGPAAPWGIGMQNTWQMAVDDINNGGDGGKRKALRLTARNTIGSCRFMTMRLMRRRRFQPPTG